MKTYLKRPYEKSLTEIYYSSSDVLTHFSTHVDVRQRMLQPSTRKQQHRLASFNTHRLQHVHWGKYGIKPLDPSESNRKLRKVITLYITVCLDRNKSLEET